MAASQSLTDADGQEVRTLRGHTSRVHVVAFSPDGRLVASGGADQSVKVWETAAGKDKELRSLPGHTDYVFGMAFSADGRRLASAGEEKIIHIWDVATGALLGSLIGHTDRIPGLVWHPDGAKLYSAGANQNTVQEFSYADGVLTKARLFTPCPPIRPAGTGLPPECPCSCGASSDCFPRS